MIRAASLLPLAWVIAGCYRPQTYNARGALAELREEERARGAGGTAARPQGAGDVIDVEEAVARALRDNPTLRAARHERGMAEGQVIAARAVANPTLDLQLLHLQALPAGLTAWSVEAGWEPPQPEIYSARSGVARANLDAVRAEIGERELELAAAVRAAHASLVTLGEQRAILDEAIAVRRRIRALVEKRVAGGASTRLDLGLADLALATLERDRDDLAAREILAARQLADLLGVTRAPAVRGSLGVAPGALPDLAALEDQALSARPALAAADARCLQREQALRLEHGKRWPWFRFSAAPRYRSNDQTTYPSDFAVGVQLMVPIFDRNDGPIQVAEWAREQERERLRKLVADVRRELATALDEIALRRATLERFRAEVLPAIERHEKLLATAVAGGQLDLVAVLQAEDVILRSRRDYAEVRLAYHKAWLALDRAVGGRAAGGAADGTPGGPGGTN